MRHAGSEARPVLLVLRALGMGDLLTAVPALRALAAAFPDHRRVLAAPAMFAPLLDLAGDVVDDVLDTDFRHGVGALPSLGGDMPEIAVNLHGRGPESHAVLRSLHPARLIAFGAQVAGDIPWRHTGPAWRAHEDDEHGEHEVHRWCRLLCEEGIRADPEDLYIAPPERPPTTGVRGATLLHPGAASPARRWPAERWAAVARAERQAGRDVVVTGSSAERALAEEVARIADLPPASVLAGRTDLVTLAANVAAAGRVVCGDTGVAHLATALGRPSVVLFGPTSPSLWGPPAHGPHHALWKGGTGDPHAQRPDAGLLAITTDDVTGALKRLDETALVIRR